jgi:hypothetical protein
VFIGHFAVAFGAKKLSPKTSLGTLVLAAEWVDLIFPLLLLAGLEHAGVRAGANPFLALDFSDYPITHSLVAGIGWSLLIGGIALRASRDVRAALVVGGAVLSHWVLDFVSHTPDMPLWPGGPMVGLGLWRNVAATVTIEGLMFAAGLWLYFRATRARDGIGRWGAFALAAFLVAVYAFNLTSPPPPSVKAVAVVGLAGWLLPLWAWWVDRHREPAAPRAP